MALGKACVDESVVGGGGACGGGGRRSLLLYGGAAGTECRFLCLEDRIAVRRIPLGELGVVRWHEAVALPIMTAILKNCTHPWL